MTSRRGFLSFLGAAVASATLDPERLLWVPGAKLISIAKAKEPLLQSVEIRPTMTTDWHGMAELLFKKFPGRNFYDVQGQQLFPNYGKDGTPRYTYSAFVLARDWKDRKQEFDATRYNPMPARPDYVIYA